MKERRRTKGRASGFWSAWSAIKATSDAAAGTVTDITKYNNMENIIKLCDILFDIAKNCLNFPSRSARGATKRNNGRNNQEGGGSR